MREIKLRIFWLHPESDSSGFDYIDVLKGWEQGDVCLEIIAIEKYTGLKDKNGKEIYEGDIYLATYRAGGAGSIRGKSKERVKHIVEWSNRGRWHGNRIEIGRGYGCCHPECELGEGIEVIGNIHENPELLQ